MPHSSHVSFSLFNPGNHCYLNSYLYALVAVAHATNLFTALPATVQSLSGRQGVRALQLLGFFMLGWPDAEMQHDVAELIDYLHPKLAPRSLHGSLQGRRQGMTGGLERTVLNPITRCISLPTPRQHSPHLQDLINNWHNQERCCRNVAVCAAAAFPEQEGTCHEGQTTLSFNQYLAGADFCLT